MRLGDLPNTALTMVFVAVIFVAGFLVLGGITTDSACDQTGYEFNASTNLCQQTTNFSATLNPTHAGNASIKIQTGMDNITDYASTWGTIIGVAVLLAIVIGGFAFGRNKGMF